MAAQHPGMICCAEAIELTADPEATERVLRLLRSACANAGRACVAVAPGAILFGFVAQPPSQDPKGTAASNSVEPILANEKAEEDAG